MKRGRPKGVKSKSRKIELVPRTIKNNRDYTHKPKCENKACRRYAKANGYCYICYTVLLDSIPTPQEIDEMEKEMGRIAVNNLGFLHSLMIEAPFGLTPVDYRAAKAQDNGITPEEKEE
jgi:hypothetical protein